MTSKLILITLMVLSFNLQAAEDNDDLGLPDGVTMNDDGDLIFGPFAENVEGGVNTQFKYDDTCRAALKSAVAQVKNKNSEFGKAIAELELSAEELDNQVKIVTDSRETDLNFRQQVQDPANASASSVLYSLKQIGIAEPKVAETLVKACEFDRVVAPIVWSDKLRLFLTFSPSVPTEE